MLVMRIWITLVLLFLVSSCTSFVVTPLVDPLAQSLQRQTDLELVCDGTPALLLMIDGFITSEPKNKKLLMIGTQSYSAYGAALTECGNAERAAQISIRAKEYGMNLLSLLPGLKESLSLPLDGFTQSLKKIDSTQVKYLFWGGYGWASWIQHESGSAAAIADLLKVEQIMLRVLELDETFYNGAAHLFLGAYYGAKPKLYGGKPEESRFHFERALAISNRQFLLVQVAYAETYGRMVFDRKLYENLLKEVLDFPLEKMPEQALSNQVAKRRARRLLDEVDMYF